MSKEKEPKQESEFPQKTGSESGTIYGYSVEARNMSPKPAQFGTIILNNDWMRVHFENIPDVPGIPPGDQLDSLLFRHSLFSYPAAQALRWWFHAEIHADCLADMLLETRLVKHQLDYKIETNSVSAHEYIGSTDGANRKPTR